MLQRLGWDGPERPPRDWPLENQFAVRQFTHLRAALITFCLGMACVVLFLGSTAPAYASYYVVAATLWVAAAGARAVCGAIAEPEHGLAAFEWAWVGLAVMFGLFLTFLQSHGADESRPSWSELGELDHVTLGATAFLYVLGGIGTRQAVRSAGMRVPVYAISIAWWSRCEVASALGQPAWLIAAALLLGEGIGGTLWRRMFAEFLNGLQRRASRGVHRVPSAGERGGRYGAQLRRRRLRARALARAPPQGLGRRARAARGGRGLPAVAAAASRARGLGRPAPRAQHGDGGAAGRHGGGHGADEGPGFVRCIE